MSSWESMQIDWRTRIPEEWKGKQLFDMPLDDKVRCGLAQFPTEFGDPSCPLCKQCPAYHKGCYPHMYDQSNCASHQMYCGYPHTKKPQVYQTTLYEFSGSVTQE